MDLIAIIGIIFLVTNKNYSQYEGIFLKKYLEI